MKEIIQAIKNKPINLILIAFVLCLYFLNNNFFKQHTTGWLQEFMISYFNDFICPLFFLSYSNILLLSVNREIKKFKWIMLFVFCAGLVWEFFAPLIKSTTTTDLGDLCFYMLGAVLYWCILKTISIRRGSND